MKLIPQSPSRERREGSARLRVRRAAGRERGIALVITLILLAVITFMAIAFLVLSSGQRNAVTSSTDQNVAKYGADAGLARAEMELMGSILVSTNPFSIGLQVSTNYINRLGFLPGVSNPTNVNYDFTSTGTPLTRDQQLQNLTNLVYDPRPPVFITNSLLASNDFRYYIDLNRNRRFESTGWLPVTDPLGRTNVDANGKPILSYLVGDPQWIGGLEFPDRNHSANNPFTYRYAYVVVPASQTLDINYIHNYAKRLAQMGPGTDSFLRNQGVGTWEVNLGGFLADLNTNLWDTVGAPYTYYADPATYNTLANRGTAFDDALSLLRYRYAANLATLASVSTMFGTTGVTAFASDYIDGYSAGPPMTGTWWPGAGIQDRDAARVGLGWSGSFNTNHYLSTQELFDPTKTSLQFANRLASAGTARDSYDQYTFYRLLSQLGTDSTPEPPGKINLNYDNLARPNGRGIISATNFYPWDPVTFFTNTAAKLLINAGYTVGDEASNYGTNLNLMVANALGQANIQIPVWPVNYYTPSIHRTFQMAANIYDATTNRAFVANQAYPYCPAVFRPLFRQKTYPTPYGTNITVVYIVGYREAQGTTLASTLTNGAGPAPLMYQLETLGPTGIQNSQIPQLGTPFRPTERQEPLVWGVPLVVGAKKGFPNFNEFSMQTGMFISRLLEFRRAPGDTQGPVVQTNQMYVVGITNAFGLEAWNSYSNTYPRKLQLIGSATMTAILTLTNESGQALRYTNSVPEVLNIPIAQNAWHGWTGLGDVGRSFILPWGATNAIMFLTNSTYHNSPSPSFGLQTHIFVPEPGGVPKYIPHLFLNLNTRLLCILVDVDAQRIVDYVNLDNWQDPVDVMGILSASAQCNGDPRYYSNPAEQWCTNRNNWGVPYGILNQIGLSFTATNAPDINSFSQDPYSGLDVESAVDGFRYNLMGWGPIFQKDQGKAFYKSNVFYVPFDPYKPLYVHASFQANDPLVHYTIGDLLDLSVPPSNRVDFVSHHPPLDNIGQINHRYDPWGGSPSGTSQPDFAETEVAVKDPLVTRSDAWDFPTNRFPNVGWLGRVHRGTPWQTIYLKSPNILLRQGVTQVNQNLASWEKWTGNRFTYVNLGQISATIYSNRAVYTDAVFSLPTNDWRVLDLFTTAFNDNATRGQLSVNQTNLAAWSAILSGVNVLPDATTNGFIAPAGVYDPTVPPPLVRLVNGIINARTNFPNNSYQRLGDILAAPELTVNSPYILTNSAFVNDDVMERIPQQILGLLKGGEAPRFVIYSYGQALKPAVRSIVTSGPYFGLCTNYQITAEVVTRAVVRIDGAQPVPGQPYRPHAVVENFNVLPPD
ncbi:MAG TPA: pilus assembly PilX N-terminal domain-containing protein [Candidatus Acidoferrum sp.]|jgi:hypothetical protein|nr:pilus assembly PilX N-terminal domain-containing protein [Candidatus Acidoferrum sp.]